MISASSIDTTKLEDIPIKNIYWLAGLLEGEGCFGLSSGCIRISLNMTDRDIVEQVADLFGCRVSTYQPLGNRKRVYSAEIFSNRAAGWMMTLYSLMGERRKIKIRESLLHWKSQRLKNPQGAGRRNPRTRHEQEAAALKRAAYEARTF